MAVVVEYKSFSSFYLVANVIKDKSAEALTTLSSDLQEFKSIVQEDVAELSKNNHDPDQHQDLDENQVKNPDYDRDINNKTLPTVTKNSLMSFNMGSTLESLVQWVNVTNSLESLKMMGSKLLNSADEFIGSLAGDAPYEREEKEELSERDLSARKNRIVSAFKKIRKCTQSHQ
ncbi:unnamed protein product [Peronospora belbahrii]|uniref:Uncharacterized protein n=1 Tax=Peronospora belbahrii TaxID=622444 RepID=A0ABN8CR89_9STRA|nr:unnamed protein product [Peronospora belbahrii]